MTTQQDRIEWKLDQLLEHCRRIDGHGNEPKKDASFIWAFPRLSCRQHGALQMLIHGKSNQEIAERFSVTENTAKVYVRTIAKKLGVHSRAQILAKTMQAYEAISEMDYEAVSGGLPKDWDENYKQPDQYAVLFSRRGGDDGA